MSVKVVNSGSGVINITAETIPTIKVSSPTVSVVDINPVVTGSTIGPTGAQGPAGSDGQGLEAGGDKHQVLKKVDDVDYNTEWGFADRVFISVKFDEAVSAGDPVYVSGYQPGQDVVKVSKADSSDSAKMPAIGLAIEDYSLNEFGSVACIGSLYGIDTDDFDVGDVLYVKSGGGLTKDKPTGATNLIQNVGKVGRSQQNNGEIVVMAIGRSNDVPNIADGKIWIGNGSGVATPTTLNAAAIPDFDTEVSNNSSVVANTAKETNVTTDLGLTQSSVNVTVTSSDGTNATIPPVSTTLAGVMTAAEHVKLSRLNASADVTNSSSVEAAGAIMDSDFTSNGLMERTGDGSYDVVAKNTDNIPEGSSNLYYTDAKVTTLLGNTNVSALANGSSVIFTTTEDVSSASFVDTDNTFAGATNNLVPSQLAVKTYVDNQLGTQNLLLGSVTGTAVTIDISGGGTSATIPAATTDAAGVMTEAQFDKLAGIEANADVTDTANVTAAGALMDSEVTNLQDVKDFDPDDYATAAQGAAADAALPLSGGTMTGLITFAASQQFDGRDVSVDGNKLDGIESGADVTDATNVANAGAVMNSGNESIDGVKTFTSTISGSINGNAATVTNGVYTTSSVTALSDVSDAGSGIIMSTAERTKLTGIEANATADQTDAEIRAAVEAATDSNVFTDADHSKLNGIEANATADQTAAEIRTLVESASDSNVFTDADHSKLNGIEANATADQTDAEIRAAVEAATDSNVFTDADHTKLDNIAANATNYGDSDVNSHLSGGTGIGYNNGVISVSGATTFSTADSGDDVKAVITGPNNGTSDLIFAEGSNVTLTQSNGTITIAATSGGIDAVEDDTDPDLGGDLDVGTHEIQSTSANNLVLKAAGTGKASLSAINGDVELVAQGSGKYIKAKGDFDIGSNSIVTTSSSTDITLTPHGTGNVILGNFEFDVDQDLTGKNDYVLTYDDSSGHISLEEASGGVASGSSAANTYVAFFTDSGSTIDGDSGLVFNSSSNRLTTNEIDVLRIRMNQSTSQLTAAGKSGYGARTASFGSIAAAGLTAGTLIHLNGTWDEADSDNLADSTGLLAVATSTSSSHAVMSGPVRMADASLFNGSGVAEGDPLFVAGGVAAGKVTATRPSGASDIIRIVGYVLDKTNAIIYFNPSNDWIQLNA